MSDLFAEAKAFAEEIDNRLGPISGRRADRLAVLLRAIVAEHDRRVTELLEANNREVERRREAEGKVALLNEVLWEMMYGYSDDETRMRAFAALKQTDA